MRCSLVLSAIATSVIWVGAIAAEVYSGTEALVRRCVQCHGPTLQMGNLALSSRGAVLAGDTRGPAIVPGEVLKDPVVCEATEALKPAPSATGDGHDVVEANRELLTLHELMLHRQLQLLVGQPGLSNCNIRITSHSLCELSLGLGFGMTLLGRLAEPPCRLGTILHNPLALPIHEPKVVLS